MFFWSNSHGNLGQRSDLGYFSEFCTLRWRIAISWRVNLEKTSGMVTIYNLGTIILASFYLPTVVRPNTGPTVVKHFDNIHVLNRVSKLQEWRKIIPPFLFQFQRKSKTEIAR